MHTQISFESNERPMTVADGEAREKERLEVLKNNILGKVVKFDTPDVGCVKGVVTGWEDDPPRFIVEVTCTHKECKCRPSAFAGRIN